MPVLNTADAVYLGNTAADAVYLGDTLVWLPAVAWSPTDIPGLLAWIDPAQDTYAEGERIATYVDHAQGLAFTGSAADGPIFHTGPPRLEFPNPNSGLTAHNVNLGPAGFTFVLVDTAADTINYPMKIVSGTAADGWEFRHDGSTVQIVERYSTYGIYFSGQADPPNVKTLHVMRVTSGVLTEVWVNDVLYQNGWTAVAHNLPLDLFIARRADGYSWRGTMNEVLVCAGPISDTDLALLRDYLEAKHFL
jgi:hypothetical protein